MYVRVVIATEEYKLIKVMQDEICEVFISSNKVIQVHTSECECWVSFNFSPFLCFCANIFHL